MVGYASLERHQARSRGGGRDRRAPRAPVPSRPRHRFKLAAAAANKAGSPFNKHDDRRFGALRHSGEEQPTGDDLRELLDLATLATGRRIADTIAAAAAAHRVKQASAGGSPSHRLDPNDPRARWRAR